jgi:hypothetical protein
MVGLYRIAAVRQSAGSGTHRWRAPSPFSRLAPPRWGHPSTMRWIFITSLLLGIYVFAVRRRKFDLLAVGFLCSGVYLFPGIFGFTADRNFEGLVVLENRAIEPEAYLVMTWLLLLISAAGLLYDEVHGRRDRLGERATPRWFRLAAIVATMVGGVGFAGTVVTAGPALLDPDKSVVLAVLGRWYVLWSAGALVGLLCSLQTRTWWCAGVCVALLAADVFVGFRNTAAMVTIGVFTLFLARRPAGRLLARGNWGWITAGLLVGLFFFVYKGFYIAVKTGAWEVIEELALDSEYVVESVLLSSEPFNTTGTLNEVVRTDFHVGWDHYRALAYGLVPFAPELGGEEISFNDRFQPVLFPAREAGLASNFLAEAWSAGGRPAVAAVTLLYVALLWLGSRLLQRPEIGWRLFAAVFFPYWAFYIHRNDLLYQIILQRRVLAVFLFAIGLAWIVHRAVHLGSSREQTRAVPAGPEGP